jgi:probable O-glycosylation ligase (exosortase A-associated)
MRSYLLFLAIMGTIPVIFAKPYFGVLVYSWVSYMNPHRLTWGFTYSFPFAMIVAVATIGAWMISRESKKIPMTALSVLIIAYTFWVSFTTLFAILPDAAFAKWDRSIKTLLITFLTMALINSRERLDALIWVIVVSLGFFGVRGGVFTALTAGNYHVWGPADSFIEDNNHLGAALIMALPLMRYLQLQAQRRYIRLALLGSMGLTGLAILGTQSRGAALAGATMLIMLWLRSRKKLFLGVGLVIGVSLGLAFMPQKYFDRLDTINEYENDGSAEGRIQTWKYAWRFALTSPIVGGGFEMFASDEMRHRFTPGERVRASHSIWFETLGEHGFVGLLIFVAIGAAALLACGRVRRQCKGFPERVWAFDLASNLQVTFVGFAVAGTFLNKAFYDMYWQLLAVTVVLSVVVSRDVAAKSRRAVPDRNAGTEPIRPQPPLPQPAMVGDASRLTPG